jgi:hypothetical protein
MRDEEKRKIRISAGAFQAMAMLSGLLNIFKHGVLSFQYISHRVLRWSICPICLVVLFITNFIIVNNEASFLFMLFFMLQIFFYLLSLIGFFMVSYNIKISWFYIPYYFVFMNYAVFKGFFRYQSGKQTVLWEKAERQKVAR